jgi:hypothetical protein
VWQYAVGIVATVLTYQGRIHPALVVLGGAAAGLLLGR